MNKFGVKGAINSGFLRGEDGSFEVCGVPLRRRSLLRLMKRAQRGGVLHRCLNMAEYKFVSLVVKLKDKVRSFILARALAPIIKKLLKALRAGCELMIHVLGEVDYWMKVAGRALAEKVAKIAQSWGNRLAHKWAKDEGFIRYLTVMNLPVLKKQTVLES